MFSFMADLNFIVNDSIENSATFEYFSFKQKHKFNFGIFTFTFIKNFNLVSFGLFIKLSCDLILLSLFSFLISSNPNKSIWFLLTWTLVTLMELYFFKFSSSLFSGNFMHNRRKEISC